MTALFETRRRLAQFFGLAAGLAIVAAHALGAAHGAAAEDRAAAAIERLAAEAAARGAMAEGPESYGPLGWSTFCAEDPRRCAPPTRRRPFAAAGLDAAGLAQLEDFNANVNAAHRPMTDMAAHGVSDLWSLPNGVADCEDYVLAKRDALLAAGWPQESVLIGVVKGVTSPYHAVLIVRTTQGELVLDNLTDEVLPWRDTGYEWVVRQSAAAPERWVALSADAPRRAGATAD